MNIINPIKLFITTFLCITSFTANNCMLTRFKHEPVIQNPTDETNKVRRPIGLWLSTGFSIKKDDITDIRDITKQEEEGTCFAYAVNKITNGTAPLHLYPGHTSNINIQKFFKQTAKPQEHGLAIYTLSKEDRRIQHCAVIITPEKFESKLGIRSKISHHKPFSVPLCYGNAISFWVLKKKFTNAEDKLHEAIDKDINQTLGQQLSLLPATSEDKKKLHETINKDSNPTSIERLLLSAAIEGIGWGIGLGMVLLSLLDT